MNILSVAAIATAVFTFTATPQTSSQLIVSPSSVGFSVDDGDTPAVPARLSALSTAGVISYTVSASSDGGWLLVIGSSPNPDGSWDGNTPGTVTVFAIPKGLPSGKHTGEVIFTSANAANSPVKISVTLTVAPVDPILLRSTPASLSFSLPHGVGGLEPKLLGISSSGDMVAFTAATNASWLMITPPFGATPSSISVSVIPAGLSTGTYSASISVTSPDASSVLTVPVTLSIEASRVPSVSGIVNAASFTPGISTGSWISIFGKNLADMPPPGRAWRGSEIVGSILPTNLEGTTVSINGEEAAISWVGPNQLNVLVPSISALGVVAVRVATAFGSIEAQTNVLKLTPGLFANSFPSRKYAAAVHPDGALVGRPEFIPGARPARPGDVIMFFGTGFGPTEPPIPAGVLVTDPAPLSERVEVRIGGVAEAGQVRWAGLVGAGLYQINVRIPTVRVGDHPVVAEIGGVASQSGVLVPVDP